MKSKKAQAILSSLAMKKGTYPLLTFRHPDHKQVYFIALSPFFKTVLELIQDRQMTGRKALLTTAKQFALEDAQVLAIGEKFLGDLFDQCAIYGFKVRS